MKSKGALAGAALLGLLSACPGRRTASVSPPRQCGPGAELAQSAEPEVRVIYGYKDARPARFVGDRYEKMATAEILRKPCEGARLDCGFTRSADDEELFTKPLRGADGRTRVVRLRLAASSASPDDLENRRDPFQAWKSRRAAHLFAEGLRSADAVFYDGHSRDGGGPDFTPPRLRADRHVDYAWYLAHRPGLKVMEQSLQAASRPARVVGLYSCDSDHFHVSGTAAKKVRWITYDKLYYFADAMKDLHATLSGLLAGQCGPP